MSYQRPIFHDDNYGKYLLGIGPRYINVHQNWAGEYYFSTAFLFRGSADASQLAKLWKSTPTLYRIIVRQKAVSA